MNKSTHDIKQIVEKLALKWTTNERQYRSQVAEARIITADEAWEIAREDAGLVYMLVPLIYPLAFAAMPGGDA